MKKSLEEQLNEIFDDMKRKEEEKWNNMTPQEKIDTYKEQGIYSRYCYMSIEELEEEKGFNEYKANQLRNSKFSDPYYSAYGCEENIRRINTILRLKKEMEEGK